MTGTELHGWVPVKTSASENDLICKWHFVNSEPFTAPFFEDTMGQCYKYKENNHRYKSYSSLQAMLQWGQGVDCLQPTAFIFHVSRCGSTLLSQALSLNSNYTCLSEVPFLDEMLRLPHRYPQVTEEQAGSFFQSALAFYAAKRSCKEEKLFIKLDSWHLMFYRQIRSLYPHTPFIILTRHPAEVVASHLRQRGIQCVPGLIEPSVYGFAQAELQEIHPDEYLCKVLNKFYLQISAIHESDQNALVLDYSLGLEEQLNRINNDTGLNIHLPAEQLSERLKYHAKHPEISFQENPLYLHHWLNLEPLLASYHSIKEKRI